MRIKQLLHFYAVVAFVVAIGVSGCSEEPGWEGIKEKVRPDYSKPVGFTDYMPKKSSVRALTFIDGSNFGTDVSKIRATIGGVDAPVVGTDGNTIVIMTPRLASEGTVYVEILRDNGEVYASHEFPDKVEIEVSNQVGTLLGKIDTSKSPDAVVSSRIDGTFEEAELENPWWLEITKNNLGEKILLLHDARYSSSTGGSSGHMNSVREINLDTRMVRTLFTRGEAGAYQVLSMTMDPTKDTLFIVDDNGKGNESDRYAMPVMFYSIRANDFQKPRPYLYGECGYSAVFMNDGQFFYNRYSNTSIIKCRTTWNNNLPVPQWELETLFSPQPSPTSGHQFMIKHPEDKYIYVTGAYHRIIKVVYDKVNQTFIPSGIVVAGNGSSGYTEGVGQAARMNFPRQGVFVKNQQYVAEGKEDVYDFYFCDHNNNCIRKLTPDGVTSLYAGRGSQGSTSQVYGWIDGDAILDAQFREPVGITYDEETETFYVADRNNHRIRTIRYE